MDNLNSDNVRWKLNLYLYVLEKNSTGTGSLKSKDVILDFDSVENLEIFSKLNEFVLTGNLVYLDKKQQIDQALGKINSYLHVGLWKTEVEKDPKGKVVEQHVFDHEFQIVQFDIIQRSGSFVKYGLRLISSNWIKFEKPVHYSTWKTNSKEGGGKILMNMFNDGLGLKMDASSENAFPAISYMTKNDDTVVDAFKYITANTVDGMESIKFLAYDPIGNVYGFVDIAKPGMPWFDSKTNKCDNFVELSMFDNGKIEKFLGKRDNQKIETVSFNARDEFVRTLLERKRYSYSEETPSLQSKKSFDSSDIIKLYSKFQRSSSLESVGYETRINGFVLNGEIGLYHSEPDWEDDCNIYSEMCDNILNTDSIAITVPGDVNRMVGDRFIIAITNPEFATNGDSKASTDTRLSDKYRNLNGDWIIAAVRHVFSSTKQDFSDVVTLSRSWTIASHS